MDTYALLVTVRSPNDAVRELTIDADTAIVGCGAHCEVRLSAGAEFVVAICGEIMTMPGLPKAPAAEKMAIHPDGSISGLF